MPRILLIEDNPDNAEFANRVLATAGFEVQHYIKGLDAARAARKDQPDLVLLDFNLPDIDGRNLILTLKRQLGHIPIVAVTARASQLEQQLAMRFGCDAFITKPYQPETLIEVVHKLLETAPKH